MRERERQSEEEFSGLTVRPLFVFSCACHLCSCHDIRPFPLYLNIKHCMWQPVPAFAIRETMQMMFISLQMCCDHCLVTSTQIIDTFPPRWKQKYADRALWLSLKPFLSHFSSEQICMKKKVKSLFTSEINITCAPTPLKLFRNRNNIWTSQ